MKNLVLMFVLWGNLGKITYRNYGRDYLSLQKWSLFSKN